MTETVIEERAISKSDQWRERLAEQERSGLSVRQFCQQRGWTQYSFYAWRKRLRQKETVRFALVDREAARPEAVTAVGLELVLTTGERLRIGVGVEAATLRTVLDVLRA